VNFDKAPASALRTLVQIDMGELLGKDLQGVRGWREVSKIATGISGSEDMGRIYYKPGGVTEHRPQLAVEPLGHQ
jgi:hypothetical protein